MVEVVGEISGNHGGELRHAIKLIEVAKQSGADAVKFQCFTPELLARRRAGIMWRGAQQTYEDLLSLYNRTLTRKDWFPTLIAKCEMIGLPWFSSVFDPPDVDFLEDLDCPRYKISAYEVLHGDLINAVVRTGKPIIMSVRHTDNLTIMKATKYGDDADPLGLSDHTFYGAANFRGPMVERHIYLPDVECEDSFFSSTPKEFAHLVQCLRKRNPEEE